MKKNLFVINSIIFCIFILIVGCSKNMEPPVVKDPVNPPVVAPEIDPIEEQIKNMTLEEKIGQLLMIGIEGKEISDIDIEHIHNLRIGGFILFSRNIDNSKQVLTLLNSLKEENRINKIPIFLSIDEEGGTVSRLSKIFKNLPNVSVLGNLDDENISFEYGKNLGIKLKSLGFNVNFAPVLDINSNPKNPVIGNRAIGTNAKTVSKHGIKVMNGIKSRNIIPVVKHFPGHGDTSVDSHLELPRVDKTLEELENLELIPFQLAIAEDVNMIMVAHILYPKVDDKFPSSLSDKIIDDLLRDKLGFDGVVISDDMTMRAIIDNFSIEEASLKFLQNGGDIVLICHGSENPKLVYNRLIDAVENGELTIEKLEEKVYRILKLKKDYGIDDNLIENIEIEEVDVKTTELINKIN